MLDLVNYARVLYTASLVALWGLRTVVSGVLSFKRGPQPHLPQEVELPTMSVVIPAYNEGPVLPGTIEACNNLDYPANKLELVICYEADSVDRTEEIAEAAADCDQRFKTVRRDEPGGDKSKAVNCALEQATGDIIASIDADHEFEEEILVEDTDMSSKLHEAGKKIKIDPTIITYEENPATLDAWWDQRKRWARGWMQVANRYLFSFPKMNNPTWTQRADAVYTLSHAVVPALLVIALSIGVLTWFTPTEVPTYIRFPDWILWTIPFVAPDIVSLQDWRNGLSITSTSTSLPGRWGRISPSRPRCS